MNLPYKPQPSTKIRGEINPLGYIDHFPGVFVIDDGGYITFANESISSERFKLCFMVGLSTGVYRYRLLPDGDACLKTQMKFGLSKNGVDYAELTMESNSLSNESLIYLFSKGISVYYATVVDHMTTFVEYDKEQAMRQYTIQQIIK